MPGRRRNVNVAGTIQQPGQALPGTRTRVRRRTRTRRAQGDGLTRVTGTNARWLTAIDQFVMAQPNTITGAALKQEIHGFLMGLGYQQ
jgi:hypothetical protein